MINVYDDNKSENFLAEIMRLIVHGQRDKAVEMLRSIESSSALSIVLKALIDIIIHDLDNSRDFANDIGHAFNLAHNLAGDLDRIREIALSNNLDIVHDLDRAIKLSYDFSHILAHDLDLVYVIIQVLSPNESRSTTKTHSNGVDNAAATFQFTLNGIDFITPQNLADTLSPYLQAIVDLQHIIDDLKGRAFSGPRIVSISQNSILGIDVTTNVSEAVDIVKQLSTYERHEQSYQADRLDIKSSREDIPFKQAKVYETEPNEIDLREDANASQGDVNSKLRQYDKSLTENTNAHFVVEKARVELALAVIKELAPNLPEVQRTALLLRLMQPLGVLHESSLRPYTLPK